MSEFVKPLKDAEERQIKLEKEYFEKLAANKEQKEKELAEEAQRAREQEAIHLAAAAARAAKEKTCPPPPSPPPPKDPSTSELPYEEDVLADPDPFETKEQAIATMRMITKYPNRLNPYTKRAVAQNMASSTASATSSSATSSSSRSSIIENLIGEDGPKIPERFLKIILESERQKKSCSSPEDQEDLEIVDIKKASRSEQYTACSSRSEQYKSPPCAEQYSSPFLRAEQYTARPPRVLPPVSSTSFNSSPQPAYGKFEFKKSDPRHRLLQRVNKGCALPPRKSTKATTFPAKKLGPICAAKAAATILPDNSNPEAAIARVKANPPPCGGFIILNQKKRDLRSIEEIQLDLKKKKQRLLEENAQKKAELDAELMNDLAWTPVSIPEFSRSIDPKSIAPFTHSTERVNIKTPVRTTVSMPTPAKTPLVATKPAPAPAITSNPLKRQNSPSTDSVSKKLKAPEPKTPAPGKAPEPKIPMPSKALAAKASLKFHPAPSSSAPLSTEELKKRDIEYYSKNYSNLISEIFRTKKHIGPEEDEYDSDDESDMESSYHEIRREENRSARMAIKEDYEEWKKSKVPKQK